MRCICISLLVVGGLSMACSDERAGGKTREVAQASIAPGESRPSENSVQMADKSGKCLSESSSFQWGVDSDGNGRLEGTEIAGTSVVCKSSANLAVVLQESPGASCAVGGRKLLTGVDTNGDGKLQADEVKQASITCNAPGGKLAMIATSPGGAIATSHEAVAASKSPIAKMLEQPLGTNSLGATPASSAQIPPSDDTVTPARANESDPNGPAPANLAGLLGNSAGPMPSEGVASGAKPTSTVGTNQADLEATVRAYQPGIKRKCWDATQGTAGVNAMATITLAADGSVENVTVSANEPTVGKCIEQQIARWSFPVGNKTTVNVPFKFVRQ